jgi:hypothetical protein
MVLLLLLLLPLLLVGIAVIQVIKLGVVGKLAHREGLK